MLDKFYVVFIKKPQKDGKFSEHPAGRFISHNGHMLLLEDYHGLLSRVLKSGQMGHNELSLLDSLKKNPYFRVVSYSDLHKSPTEPAPEERSVFEYHHGKEKPKLIEFINGIPHSDGVQLPQHEIDTIRDNVSSGNASIKYRFNKLEQSIKKMEKVFENLIKSDEDTAKLTAAFAYLREKGKTDPEAAEHAKIFTKLVYQDLMAPEVGSKRALEDFLSRPRGGVHVMMDGNDFKSINDNFGHKAGDDAIKMFAKTLRNAADAAAPGQCKVFRAGGDEFAAHFPSMEHAAKFLRQVHQNLDAVPPLAGTHKLSMSFGLGNTLQVADEALKKAKDQKMNPQDNTQRRFEPGKVPNLAHSLVPGSEGPIPISS